MAIDSSVPSVKITSIDLLNKSWLFMFRLFFPSVRERRSAPVTAVTTIAAIANNAVSKLEKSPRRNARALIPHLPNNGLELSRLASPGVEFGATLVLG